MKKIIKRSQKVMFMETTEDNFERMVGFTALSTSKNPKEYTRQYVDEEFETTDIVGMSTSTEFALDQMVDNAVHEKIVNIADKELVGSDAIVTLLRVDLSDETHPAVKRNYVVVPGTEGDSMDAYTYGGTFKVNGAVIEGTATSTDDFKTNATFVPTTPTP